MVQIKTKTPEETEATYSLLFSLGYEWGSKGEDWREYPVVVVTGNGKRLAGNITPTNYGGSVISLAEYLSKYEFIEWQEKKERVESGDRYKHDFMGEYIVARVDAGKYSLISLDNGNRHGDPVEDINKIFCGDREEFVKL